ncbi:50S ribosomal protein L5 [Rickettsiales bacterium (ex Bugula neritina AB1)]|nr:50S ribosomal protein L5 [Rickettsiales bacterium (ex Bugula neritina AB1)]
MTNRTTLVARLKEEYDTRIAKELQDELGCSNIHEVPKITSIILDMCCGKALKSNKDFKLERNKEDLHRISFQKPLTIKAKKSIAAFSLRRGMDISLKVTLRGKKMYLFLDRFINIACVQNNEFNGFNIDSINKNNNKGFSYCYGLKDISIFPEIKKISLTDYVGMGISIHTNCKNKESLELLLNKFRFPFIKKGGK